MWGMNKSIKNSGIITSNKTAFSKKALGAFAFVFSLVFSLLLISPMLTKASFAKETSPKVDTTKVVSTLASVAYTALPKVSFHGEPNTVVLDPGHSPKRPGATSCSGVAEHVYNSTLTSAVAKYLKIRGFIVSVTRSPDGEATPGQRAKHATGKNLLLSIHHDSVQPQFLHYTNGNPCSYKAQGFSIFVSSKNAHFKVSLEAARVLGQSLRNSGLEPSVHHAENIPGENRQVLDKDLGIYLLDDLLVLKQAESPAILLEAGVIVNPVDDARVKTKEFHTKVAKAVAATVRYVATTFHVEE